ncbi:hypothetical protein NDU88_007930 [Pleurodeles waltl]|uniref:Uncharacterized protein n=1 Tax=Pleurodeles waltl TaxID=8319 RepID=A0AAV7N3H8_PLEWA|nr:hypothetical protein NDU88_007930 [Pleurodeles waltl]
MSAEFGSIEEDEWRRCDDEDLVLQEVKRYVMDGWPGRNSIAAEIEPYGKVWDELDIENELLFKNGKCIPPKVMYGNGMQSCECLKEMGSCEQQEVMENGSCEGENVMELDDRDVNVNVNVTRDDNSVASRVKSYVRTRRQPAKIKDFV